jgi:hypothetical protein
VPRWWPFTDGAGNAGGPADHGKGTDAQLVDRQLSDRDRDPVSRESMAVAQALAQSLLD